jgi:NTE family protein
MKRYIFIFFFIVLYSLYSQPKIGLALSGGGARCLAQIGMLKVLDELDIQIDYIAGTSIGSVIGGLYAMGYTANEIEDIILTLDWQDIMSSRIRRQDLSLNQKRWLPYANYYFNLNKQFIPELPQAFLFGNSLINTFFDLTYSVSFVSHFDDLPIPFRTVATNIITGEMVIIEDWKLHEAMRASMSFPSILQPFEKDGCLYIDGGIRGNLPVKVVKNMGADLIIGFQTSSGLKKKNQLQSLIDVLDQTINIGVNDNVEIDIQDCELLIKPELNDIQLLDFHKRKEIIRLGEESAREHIVKLAHLPKRTKQIQKLGISKNVKLTAIQVQGQNYLSSNKIKEYIGLKKGENYSSQDISAAFAKAYHSSLFTTIYPTLIQEDDGAKLVIHVKEKPQNLLGIGFVYRNQNEMNVNLILEMNNYFQKNSKFISNLKLGAENEWNIDYVKNFGKSWGIYFRLFPNVKEYRLYTYNTSHQKISSVRSFGYGATFGIGAFADQAVAMEWYSFADKSRYYQDIGEFDTATFSSSGLGIKFYHESLDGVLFPMQGAQGIAKFTLNRIGFTSDEWHKKMYSKIRLVIPMSPLFAPEYRFEYGSYFRRSDFVNYDPFYIGGIDSFVGLHLREKSAPIYKINTFQLRFKMKKSFYLTATYNVLQLGDIDKWEFFKGGFTHGAGLEIGFDFILLPMRFAVAVNENFKSYYYLSIGYDFDPFEFSRK